MRYAFAKHEIDYESWKNLMDGIKPETRRFIENLTRKDRKLVLWKNQLEGILRTIYSYEILGDKNLLLNIVTGGGKTVIIGACIAWLKIAHHVDKFLIVVPNTIVRDRLKRDFLPEDNKRNIFEEFELFPEEYKYHINELVAHILGEGNATGMFASVIILGNIHQFYTTNTSGIRNLHWLLTKAGNLALFNDEAHNTPATEYTEVLYKLKNKVIFRLDTTATPDRADGKNPDSDMIYWYSVSEALDDGIIKSVVVYQPDSKAVELTYTNRETGEKKKVTDLDKDFKEAESNIKPFQWILDDEPMKKQMALALARLDEQKRRAKDRYKPVLFVVTTSIYEGKKAKTILEEAFDLKGKILLVTEDTAERVVGDKSDGSPLTAREAVQNLGKLEDNFEVVVSVLMLREGWDVPEVSVILLLRKFCSPVYGQQVIGRGLRKIIRNENGREILAVIDHPKLDHNWLWGKVGASRIKTVGQDEVLGDEDVPQAEKVQKLVQPDNIIEVPEPIYETKIDFEAILKRIPKDEIEKNWKVILDKKEYSMEKWTISRSKIQQIIKLYVDKKRAMEVIPGEHIEIKELNKKTENLSDDDMKDIFKEKLVEMASDLLFEAGFGGLKKGILYNELLAHIKKKIFNNKNLSEVSRKEIELALENIEEIKKTFSKPIITGILKEEKNANREGRIQ